MYLNKLQEALEEIEAQRKSLDDAEQKLRTLISSLSGTNGTASKPGRMAPALTTSAVPERDRDRLDDAVDVLRENGSPMHINQLVEGLNKALGREFKRVDIEPGINRHVNKSKRKRIEKFGPSMFGLPEWKGQRPLAESA